MKKNITINLSGRLFQIDEDACDMLQHYIDSLRSSFGKQAGGDEIVDDIESRIAELFDELKGHGTEAITIDHVKDVITRIGKPEQLTNDDEESDEASKEAGHRYQSVGDAAQGIYNNVRERTAGKKLYRNPNDKMVAGVLSGLAAYTNTDVTFWRVATVLFTFFYGTGLLLYILLAILLPEASSPEDLLRMRGMEVTPQNLADAVVDGRRQGLSQNSGLKAVVSLILKVVIGFFVVIAVLVGGAFGIGFFGVLMTIVFALVMPATSAVTLPFTLGGMGLSDVWANHPAILIGFAVALLLLLFIPAYAVIHMVLSMSKRCKPMGTGQRIVWIVLWIVAVCAVIPLGSSIGILHDQYEHETRAALNNWMTDFDRDYLNKHRFRLLKHEHCHGSYVNSGEYFTGDATSYLDAYDENCRAVYQAERRDSVEPGTYVVSCHARAQGEGAYIYATTATMQRLPIVKTMIPPYDNRHGELWEKAGTLPADSVEAELARKIRSANGGEGFGWSRVEVRISIAEPSVLCYGVSTDPSFTGEPYASRWFSACDFKVEKVEE